MPWTNCWISTILYPIANWSIKENIEYIKIMKCVNNRSVFLLYRNGRQLVALQAGFFGFLWLDCSLIWSEMSTKLMLEHWMKRTTSFLVLYLRINEKFGENDSGASLPGHRHPKRLFYCFKNRKRKTACNQIKTPKQEQVSDPNLEKSTKFSQKNNISVSHEFVNKTFTGNNIFKMKTTNKLLNSEIRMITVNFFFFVPKKRHDYRQLRQK